MSRLALPESGLTPAIIHPDNPDASTGEVDRTYEQNKRLNGTSPLPALLVNPDPDTLPSVRQPINLAAIIDGASIPGSQDLVGMVQSTTITGDYTGMTGISPGFLFGFSQFTTVANESGAGTGLSSIIGGSLEVAVGSPDGTFPNVIGLLGEVSIYGEDGAATITQAEGIRAAAPKFKNDADPGSGGEIVHAWALVAEAPTAGSGTNYSGLIQGGLRVGGAVNINQILTGLEGDLTLLGSEEGIGAQVLIGDGSGAGHHDVVLSTGANTYSDRIQFQNHDATVAAFITSTGTIGLPLATTSASASAGGGSALPALPVSYFAMEINGVTRWVPYYATP